MQYSVFLKIVRTAMMQNLARDMYEDSDFIYNINCGLIYIYMWLNKWGRWFFTSMEEKVNAEPDNKRLFLTKHKILGLLQTERSWWASIGLSVFDRKWGNEIDLQWYTFNDNVSDGAILNIDDWSEGNRMTFNGIRTIKERDSIYVKYVRSPNLGTPTNIKEGIHIDMPYELLKALELKVMSLMITSPYLEQWADLAWFWRGAAEDELRNYADSYGLSHDVHTRFIN